MLRNKLHCRLIPSGLFLPICYFFGVFFSSIPVPVPLWLVNLLLCNTIPWLCVQPRCCGHAYTLTELATACSSQARYRTCSLLKQLCMGANILSPTITLQKAPTSWTFPGVPRCLLGCAHFPGAVGRFPAWERVLGTDLKTSVNYAPSICRGFLWPIYVPPMRGCKDMKCGGLYPTHCPPRSHAVVPGIPGAPGNSSSAQ